MHGHEVTRVLYDPRMIGAGGLHNQASRRNVAHATFTDNPKADGLESVDTRKLGKYRVAPASDQKRQLGRSSAGDYTPSQLTKLNGFRRGRDARRFLFPSQSV